MKVKDLRLNLPPPPLENSKNFDVFQNYELTVERRDKLRLFLKKNGIGTLISGMVNQFIQSKVLKLKDLHLKNR